MIMSRHLTCTCPALEVAPSSSTGASRSVPEVPPLLTTDAPCLAQEHHPETSLSIAGAPSPALEDPASEDAHAVATGSMSAEHEADSDLLMLSVEQNTSDPTACRPDDTAEPPVSAEFR